MDEANTLPRMGAKAGKKRGAWRSSRAVYLLREAHFWIGLVLCIPFVLLGISGSYLTYHDEFDVLLGTAPEFHASAGPAREASAIVAAALAVAEPGSTASMITLPREEGEPAIVRAGPPGASFRDPRSRAFAVDAATLEVLGTLPSGLGGVTRLMHDLHGRLLISGGYGRPIVGWLGVGMLLLGISGLVLWWPRPGQLKQALTVKLRARGYRFHRDLHGMVGFWTLAVFVIVCFTGVYISFPQAFNAAIGAMGGGGGGGVAESRPAAPSSPGAGPVELDALVALARAAVPDAEPYMAMMPFRPGMGARVSLAYPGMAEGAPAIFVTVDPETGAVTDIRDPRQFPASATFQAWQRPLHQGDGWGPVWKFLVFVSGFLPLLFSITGVSMWLLKRRNRRRMQAA